MTSLAKRFLKDKDGNRVWAKAHLTSVYDDEGTPLSTLLEDVGGGDVPTLNAAPTSSTTTYTKDGATKDFVVGQFCRVADQQADSVYTFYQLYDLSTSGNVTTAKWEQVGGGDVRSVIMVTLSVIANGQTAASTLVNGAQVEVYNVTEDKVEATQTWHGSQLFFRGLKSAFTYRVSVSSVSGMATPAAVTIPNLGIGVVQDSGIGAYQTDAYVINIDSDQNDKTDIANAKVIINNVEYANGSTAYFVPETDFNATATAITGYTNVLTVSNGIIYSRYVKTAMITGYIILDQTSSDPATKVIDEKGKTYAEGYTVPAVIAAIRGASHRYVGTFANDTMTLKQLDDRDSTLYADGTDASTDIATNGKDVWMRLPYFFTRVSDYATDKVKIEFAYDSTQTATSTLSPDGSGWKQWGGNDLIGAYEATVASSKVYSVSSGANSTGSVSQGNFKTYARNRGTGFTIVKWRHQNIMAILFYAYYGHTNCQLICGSGAGAYEGANRYIGLKNSLGMIDTTSLNGNTNNIMFWGLENWWGCKYEWVDNVVVNSGQWTITEDDGTTRSVTRTSTTNAWVYPSKFVLGDDLDVVAAPGQSGGSDSQGYCDGQYHSSSSSRVVARSNYDANTNGGVAFEQASFDSSGTITYFGSRLAFSGSIEIA